MAFGIADGRLTSLINGSAYEDHMDALKPERLRRGDTIGIISPASDLTPKHVVGLRNNARFLESKGYRVRFGKNYRKRYGHKAGTIEQRLDDFNTMFEDDEIRAVVAARGGYNSNDLLEHIDYGMVRKNPKIFCGFSDITFMHCAINKKTDLVTFYGPNGAIRMGSDIIGEYTYRNFETVVGGYRAPLGLTPSRKFTFNYSAAEPTNRGLMNTSWKVLKEGRASGRLVGGHIFTILNLAETEYFPDFSNKILFWEDTEAVSPMTDRFLRQLEMIGVFDKIKGMLVGRVNLNEYRIDRHDYGLDKIILDVTKGYDFPIVMGMDFGHTAPMLTIPYGINARMDVRRGAPDIRLLENAVK